MKKEFNLSEERKKLFGNIELGDDVGLKILIKGVFEAIKKQDEEFIRLVESDLRKKQYPFTYDEVVEIIRSRGELSNG